MSASAAFFEAAFTFFFSSVLKIAVWETTILLYSLENSKTLKFTVSPFPNLVPSSFSKWRVGAKPSTPSAKVTTAPLSFFSLIVPSWVESIANVASCLSQGLSWVCLWPKFNLRPSTSNSSTWTSKESPTETKSDGCLIFLVQDKS